ncbi:MAG: NAD(P)-dependent oxidoreductase [Proteobacteria bacterium]|nr:NAD(P)-dependent oxidoreductase [Pseudomonadota bacterium]MBI3497461.1 NAD(P)-dependent oxidoreductase [Pseudomonadota bacterium]
MTLLVTGGNGFVMSNLARHWLESDTQARCVILDSSPPDAIALRFFQPVADRLRFIEGDVTEPRTWAQTLAAHGITHVAHGATVTPIARGTITEARREPEADDPRRVIDVSVMGTVAVLDWARQRQGLQRFLYVSSGAVYLDDGPAVAGAPLPEDGYVGPRALYGISKQASELIVARYADLFRLDVVSVRLPSMFGPMDRKTRSRDYQSAMHRLAHLAVAGSRLRVNTLDGVGDYLHAGDAAVAMALLLRAPTLRHRTYNLASGEATRTRTLAQYAKEKAPGFTFETAPADEANLLQDERLTGGKWGAYDISRLGQEFGWRSRPLREALHSYMDWIASFEGR